MQMTKKHVVPMPSRREVMRLWMDALQRLSSGSQLNALEPLALYALGNFYQFLDRGGDSHAWDIQALEAQAAPGALSFRSMAHIFISLRMALRQAIQDYTPEERDWVMERLDIWTDRVISQYDDQWLRRVQARKAKIIQRVAGLNMLNHCAAALNASLDLAAAQDATAQLALALTNADLSVVYQLDGDYYYLKASRRKVDVRGIPAPPEVVAASVELNGYRVPLELCQTVIIDEERQDTPIEVPRKALGIPELRAVMCVPLRAGDAVIGKITVFYLQPQRFDEQDIHIFEIFANHAGQAINNARLYEHLSALIAAQERQRIACEMHDTMLQTLVSLNINLRVALRHAEKGNWDRVQPLLQEARSLGKMAVQEGRDTLRGLREEDCPCCMGEDDLVDALQPELTLFAERAHIEPQLSVRGIPHVPRNVAHHLRRMVGEALNNVYRHARASAVRVAIDARADQVRLQVQDDGVGFDLCEVEPLESFGLSGMRERARLINARLTVDSAPGRGTTLIIEAPLVNGSRVKSGFG